ncbi:MAG: hypothetical protein H0T44_11995 [Gemmatimonadales bacterium]|nr:hypothetical protein [Gemmatimonadales bacterium]MDQ3427343.1 hypothetical protein [Gemmatimonadota bacterium]
MRILSAVVGVMVLAGCAGNRSSDDEAVRVRDSAFTASDTLSPDDTLYRERRVVPDTVGGLDTTSRR